MTYLITIGAFLITICAVNIFLATLSEHKNNIIKNKNKMMYTIIGQNKNGNGVIIQLDADSEQDALLKAEAECDGCSFTRAKAVE